MANFRPSATINYTGDVGGSPAGTVAANAVSGLTAFTDTVSFRDGVIPNGTLNAFSPNTGTATQDGNVVVDINYTYTDGARVADYYVIFYKQGGGIVSPTNPCIVVNPTSGVASTAKINVVPGSPYTFAFSSARVTKSGVLASSPQNQTARTVVTGNYTGNVGGSPAATVAANAANGATALTNFNTANDKNTSTPSAPTVNNTSPDITSILNQNNTIDLTVGWIYSPATANFNTSTESIDGFIVYLKSLSAPGAYTLSGASPETQYVVPVAQRTFTIPSLPSDKWYQAGIRTYRVVNKTVDSSSIKLSSITESTAYPNGHAAASHFPIGTKKTFSSTTAPYDNKHTTDTYSDAYWNKSNTTTALSSPVVLTPDGITTSYALIENTAVTVGHNINKTQSFTAGKWAVVKALVKAKSGDRGAQLRLGTTAFTAVRTFTFRFDTLESSASTGGYSSVKKLSNDWYQLTGIIEVNATSTGAVSLFLYDHATSSITYTGNGTSGIYFSNFSVYEVDTPDISGTPYDTVGDNWYNPTTFDYKTWSGSQWVSSATYGATYGSSPSTISGLSGDGVNIIPKRYSGGWQSTEYDSSNEPSKFNLFLATKEAHISFSAITAGSAPNPTSGYYGTKALKVATQPGASRNCYFASSSTTYNMPLEPRSKWILSAKVWCNTANTGCSLGVKTATSSYPTTISPSISTWTDLYGVLNLVADNNTSGLLYANIQNTTGSPVAWFDGIMLEKKVGPGSSPSTWVEGISSSLDTSVNPNFIMSAANIAAATSFLSGMGMNQGDGLVRPLLHGLLQGYAKDGDAITFANSYDSTVKPAIMFLPGALVTRGSNYSPNQAVIYSALNVTNTGFTANLKINGTSAATTVVTDSFSPAASTSPIISPTNSSVNASPADFTIKKSSTLEAFDDTYIFSYATTITNVYAPPYAIVPGNIVTDFFIRTVSGWQRVGTVTNSGTANAATTTISPATFTAILDGAVYSGSTGSSPVFAIDRTSTLFGATLSFLKVTYTTSAATPTSVAATTSTTAAVPYIVLANSFSE